MNQKDFQQVEDLLDRKLEGFEKNLDQKLDDKLEQILEQKFEEKLKFLPTKDEFFTRMDQLSGEIKSLREEVVMVTGYKDQIENHETRIGKLEEVLQP